MKLESSELYGSWSGAEIEAFFEASRIPLRVSFMTKGGLLIVPVSVACHPGGSATELGRYIPPLIALLLTPLNFFMNTSAAGALPTLMATTSDGVSGGDYFGPTRNG